ncbi:MAG: hypothetical protein ACI8PG_001661, partial [Planctomycetota bacterium]
NNSWGSYCSDVEVIGDICEWDGSVGTRVPGGEGAIDRWIGDRTISDGRVHRRFEKPEGWAPSAIGN